MPSASPLYASLLILAQLAIASAGLAIVAFYPPSQGRILLLPLTQAARGTVIRLAVDRGARLVARGPLPGSMIVAGHRDAFAGALFGSGIVALASPAGGCGDVTGVSL